MIYNKETTKQKITDDIKLYNPELKDSSIKQYVHRIQYLSLIHI